MSRPCSILFVDDEPAILRLVARSLAGAGFEILVAHDGAEALAVLEERPVDVLVTDVDMPDMDGLELCRLARRDHPDTARMLLTGNATIEKAADAINEGEILRFFQKPFDPKKFRETIAALVDRLEKLRARTEREGLAARRAELTRWLDTRFPGLTTRPDRGPDGSLDLDARTLLDRAEASGIAELRALMGKEG